MVANSEKSHEKELDTATFHAVPTQDLLKSLQTDASCGLDAATVQTRQTQQGLNQLDAAPPKAWWIRLAAQFTDLVIWILIVAALVSGAMGEWVDTAAILSIVLLNGVIGFLQEARAAHALASLQKMSAPLCTVVREGTQSRLDAKQLVVGDIIDLEAGDRVAADARLLKAFNVTVQEAALTGESVPVEKDASAALPEATVLADRSNMVYLGTTVSSGKARAVVVAIGMRTELGHIAGLMEGSAEEQTPLQKRLSELGRVLIIVCLAIVTLIFVLQMLRGGKVVEAFLTSVSLAVAAVPEGLPAVVTIALTLGVQRMVRRNALVRRLPSVETLGSVTVICTDKTGTLTRNEMTVTEVATGSASYHVSGSGYRPHGQFFRNDSDSANGQTQVQPQVQPELYLALAIGVRCNGAAISPPANETESWQVVGDPTEAALLMAGRKAGIDRADLPGTILYEIPFDSNRKLMSIAINESNHARLYVKGAPEVVLERSQHIALDGQVSVLSATQREAIDAKNQEMARRALRVLAVAYRDLNHPQATKGVESQLTFVGLIGMMDPPRDEARAAIATCREAGIRPVMITGDHPETAHAIGLDLGLIHGDSEKTVTGPELQAMSDEQLAAIVEDTSVYARTTAEHKLRIVRAWKSRGHVVAMTGDGVNDAPAIQAADIGVAMGITGTDVTKEAADMVLVDDNFVSIVSAVEEGRGIFDNIQKVLLFFLSCNFGEILLMLITSLAGWPTPLLPIHLLWINLVTDGFPALALSLEPPEPGIMRRRPRQANASILTGELSLAILWQGILVAMAGLLAFGIAYRNDPANLQHARSMTFCVIVYAELFRSLASRSSTFTLWQLGLWTNPYLVLAVVVSGLLQLSIAVVPFTQAVFEMPAHSLMEWCIMTALALMPLVVIELSKVLGMLKRRSKSHTVGTV